MKDKKILLIAIAAFAVFIAGVYVLYNYLGDKVETNPIAVQEEGQQEEQEKEPESTLAPDFTVTDADGNQVKLSDYFGKPVILNFWASWCGPCKSEMPDFNEAYIEYKDDINFLMVNLTDGSRETAETAAAYIQSQGYSFPVYYDTASEAAVTYGVYSIPVTYFIDKDGQLTAQAQSAINREILQQGIDMIYGR